MFSIVTYGPCMVESGDRCGTRVPRQLIPLFSTYCTAISGNTHTICFMYDTPVGGQYCEYKQRGTCEHAGDATHHIDSCILSDSASSLSRLTKSRVAAINVERLRVDVGARRRAQEDGGSDEVLRDGVAPHDGPRGQAIRARVVGED